MVYPYLIEYADRLAFKASLAYSDVAKADPVNAMQWMVDCCSEASKIDRRFPYFYAEFLDRLNHHKGVN